MNKFFIFIITILSINSWSQTEFFHSKILHTESQLDKFYSSISMDSTQVYFNANDYYIHAYNKKTGQLNWSYYLASKTNETPKLYKNSIIVLKHFDEYNNKSIQLNSKTGDTIKTLNINEIYNEPVFKNDIMYCTSISPKIGGAILAYDLNKNSVIWERFIAHGVGKHPYYLKDKIIANAESDNWFKIGYDGILKDTLCLKKASLFVEDIKCIENFQVLTFDNKAITESFLNKNVGEYDNLVFKSNEKLTVFIGNENLLIIGKNKKILHKVRLDEILLSLYSEMNSYKTILKIENTTVWFFYEYLLVAYDYKNPEKRQVYDLAKWKAHQILLEPNNAIAWIISKNDGQLYGLNLIYSKKEMGTQKN